MTGNQVALVVTCAGVIFGMMAAMLGMLVRIASGWSATKHEISDLKEDLKALVDNKFNDRLIRVELLVERMDSAIRGSEGGGGRQMGSRQQRQRGGQG
jgi:predicted methyltransferase MtxX (methanogen marker protein 4)